MDPNAKLWGEGSVLVDTRRYQRLVGKLIYLPYTRPNIAFSVSVVSQFKHSPYEEHLETVYTILGPNLKRAHFLGVKEMCLSSLMQIGQVQSQREDQPIDIVPISGVML